MRELAIEKFVLKNIADPLLLTDDAGGFLFVPPDIGPICGHQPAEIMAMANIRALLGSLLVTGKELDAGREVANVEIKVKGVGGREFIVLVKIKRVEWQGKARLYSFRDITEHHTLAEKLAGRNKYLEQRLAKITSELEKKTIALTEVLSLLEVEKVNVASRVSVNVQKLLLPIIDKLIEKASSFDSRYLMLVKQNLEELTSSVGIKLTSVKFRLTPKEVELCTLIKGGFSVKEIALMQNLSERTVETHRLNIRKKFGITSSRINLATYLAQL